MCWVGRLRRLWVGIFMRGIAGCVQESHAGAFDELSIWGGELLDAGEVDEVEAESYQDDGSGFYLVFAICFEEGRIDL